MTKLDLQKELLERVKEGVKPSDLKRSNNPSVKPNVKLSTSPKQNKEKPSQELSNKDLQISSLQKQLQTYKDFKEADLKIKEKYKQEIENYKKNVNELQTKIENQYKTIQALQKQLNNKQGDKGEVKLFTCSQCEQEWSEKFIKLQDKKGNKTCLDCYNDMLVETKFPKKKNSR